MMRPWPRAAALLCAGLGLVVMASGHALASIGTKSSNPDSVSIAAAGPAAETVVIQTIAVSVKETASKRSLSRFGEVYAFSPSFFAVYQNQPTRIRLWNLQPDDRHDFTLSGPQQKVLMHLTLAPLAKKSLVMTFHHAGLYTFSCSIHQPEMSGQILVLPPPR